MAASCKVLQGGLALSLSCPLSLPLRLVADPHRGTPLILAGEKLTQNFCFIEETCSPLHVVSSIRRLNCLIHYVIWCYVSISQKIHLEFLQNRQQMTSKCTRLFYFCEFATVFFNFFQQISDFKLTSFLAYGL